MRHFTPQLVDDLLDEEVAERNSLQPGLAIRDRVEHGGGCALGVDRQPRRIEQGSDCVGDRTGQRHLDEDKGLADQRRMEKTEALAIRRVEPSAQLGPSVDLMDRLVLNYFFQDRSRRRPVDALEDQKTTVEPGHEQVLEIRIDSTELRVPRDLAKDIFSHSNEHRGTARREVEAAQQFLQTGFGGLVQLAGQFGTRVRDVVRDGLVDLFRVGPETFGEQDQELQLHFGRGAGVGIEQFSRARNARSFAAFGEQPFGERAELFLSGRE